VSVGLAGRCSRLETRRNPANRYVDLAIRFVAVEKKDDKIVPTGDESPIYGGRWDREVGKYAGEPENVRIYTCSIQQLELILDEHAQIEAAGGRGAGKTGSGAYKALRKAVELPYKVGRIIAPTYPVVETARNEFLEILPWEWVIPESVLRRPRPELTLINGHLIQFRSGDRPEGLRSFTCDWTWIDEGQDVSTYASDIAWFCHRRTKKPQMWWTLTPKGGEALKRHDDFIDPEAAKDFSWFTFDSYSNPFTDKEVFDVARRRMAPDTYKIEVEACWDTVRKREEQGKLTKVFGWFDPEVHGLKLEDLMKPEWARYDITANVVQKATGQKGLSGIRYIAGVDPNYHAPNACTIYKVYAGLKPNDPDRWVVVDFVERRGNCEVLAESLKKINSQHGGTGYTPKNTFIIMDASGRYNKLNSERASYKLMRGRGFNVRLMTSKTRGNRNPHVKQSIDDVITRMDPIPGREIGWHIVIRDTTQALVENILFVEWNFDGTKFNRTPRCDPVDSMRYPVSYFAPVDTVEPMWGEAAV